MREIKSIDIVYGTTQDQVEATSWVVGKNSVEKIVERQPRGAGDKWYYDVHFENGIIRRIFNVTEAVFSKDDNTENF
ncbi:MAG: hypothetical protein ACTSQE_14870 [Candidatus Heimdallarchaeaceae archaeon]